ncbi:MAG TPA: nitrilase-related carbon-nitrogen hydrolase [Anaerolineales bacterium]|nr:nitrilase-related carbon-nitrogen hydrolase [Anaerolineales bacterium]
MRAFTLALAQIQTTLGGTDANLETHLEVIARARRDGADLVVFPELSLTGYMLQDAAEDVALVPSGEDPVFRRLLRASRSVDCVVGFVERDRRQQKYIAAAYLSRGETVHIHRKAYLPTYGLFQDGRFFSPGGEIRAFDTRFGRFGLLVCEDFWHVSSPYLLWLDGAELLLLTSASPGRGLDGEGRLETARTVERIAQTYASLFTVFVAQTNRIGFEDGLCYWGGAGVVGPDGRWIAQGPDFEESIVLAEIDPDSIRRARLRLPLLRDERPELVARTLDRIMKQVPR